MGLAPEIDIDVFGDGQLAGRLDLDSARQPLDEPTFVGSEARRDGEGDEAASEQTRERAAKGHGARSVARRSGGADEPGVQGTGPPGRGRTGP